MSIIDPCIESPNWKNRSQLEFLPSERIPGFPYDEPWPPQRGVVYEIVLSDGSRLEATLDLSRQYSAEGIQWSTRAGIFPKSAVACWRRVLP